MIWNTVVVQGNIVITEFANPFSLYRHDILLMFPETLNILFLGFGSAGMKETETTLMIRKPVIKSAQTQ